jgi:predicted ATPase
MASPLAQNTDRITALRVQGLRTLADVRLPLGGLTVLIGENGSGKSSLLEALELVSLGPREGTARVVEAIGLTHGGLDELLRHGAERLRIEVRIEGQGPPLDYAFALAKSGRVTVVAQEVLDLGRVDASEEPLRVIDRGLDKCLVLDPDAGSLEPLRIAPGELALLSFGAVRQQPIDRVVRVLERVRVHVGFEVGALWAARGTRRQRPVREPAALRRADELERFGANLANAFHTLKEDRPRDVWARVLQQAEVALNITDLRLPPGASPSFFELRAQFRGGAVPVPASALSDGELAYLCLLALVELGKSAHTLVALDEPDLHLHPDLLVRAVWLLEDLASACPIVVATHSDRLLDAVTEPARSVVLCDLDEHGATRLSRPDPTRLETWLARYRGLGQLRAEGATQHVFTRGVDDPAAAPDRDDG